MLLMLAKLQRHNYCEPDLTVPPLLWCIQVNPSRQGFYRVSYSPSLLSPLLAVLGQLSAQDRLGLLNDALALVHTHTHTHTLSQYDNFLFYKCVESE